MKQAQGGAVEVTADRDSKCQRRAGTRPTSLATRLTAQARAWYPERGTPAGGLPLTPAELRLLPYLQTHLTAEQIAEQLSVSSWTVKTQVKSIYRKLGVSSRNEAAPKATTIGLLGA